MKIIISCSEHQGRRIVLTKRSFLISTQFSNFNYRIEISYNLFDISEELFHLVLHDTLFIDFEFSLSNSIHEQTKLPCCADLTVGFVIVTAVALMEFDDLINRFTGIGVN